MPGSPLVACTSSASWPSTAAQLGQPVPLPVWHSDASTSVLGNLDHAVETAPPKVVIQIISSGITIQVCYPCAALK